MVFRIGSSFPKMAFHFQSRKVEARGEETVLRETAFYFPPQSGEIQCPPVNQIGSQGLRVAVRAARRPGEQKDHELPRYSPRAGLCDAEGPRQQPQHICGSVMFPRA